MLNNYFKYYKTDSFMHSLNPLCKILISIILIFISIFSVSIKSVFALSLVMMFIVCLSNIPYKILFEPFYKIRYFLLIIFLLFLPLGFINSFCIIYKFCILLLFYLILMKCTKFNDFIKGFYYLLFPFSFFGFPIRFWAIDCALVINFISFYIDEYNNTFKLQFSRNSLKKDFKERVYLLFRILFKTYKNALKKRDYIYIRGFNFYDDDYKFRLSDAYVVMCNLIVLVLVLVKEVVV